MFCTDDKHPSDLLEKGHIDYIIRRALAKGADPITVVKVACPQRRPVLPAEQPGRHRAGVSGRTSC